MNKISKISACLCSAALMGSSAATMPSAGMVPFAVPEVAVAATTFKATVTKEGNGNFAITNGENGGSFSSDSGINITAVADDGYFVDKVYYKSSSSSSWSDLGNLGTWKSTEYPKNAPFNFQIDSGNWELRVVFSALPDGQSNTDTGSTPSSNIGLLNINYHSSLNGATSTSVYQAPFNLDTHQLTSTLITKIASVAQIKQGLEDQGYSSTSVSPNEHTTFKGWAISDGGTPIYQANDDITYAIYQAATTSSGNNKLLDLYAVWEFDDPQVADFTADCYIDNNLYYAFDPSVHEYTFQSSADASSHSVNFRNIPSSWNYEQPVDKGTTTEVDGNVTHHTSYMKWVFYKDNARTEYLFKWVWDTTNSTPTDMTLEKALSNAVMTVRNTDKTQQATISPAFSYNTTTYTASGADLSRGISVAFSNLLSDDLDNPVIGTATTQTSTSNGVKTTTYTYPVTVSRKGESRTFYIRYVSTESEAAPSYDELSGLTAKVNGTNYSAFSPTTTSYTLADSSDPYEVVLSNIPSDWTATKNSSTDASSKQASISFTLSKGDLSRTYTFSWKAPSSQPSYDSLSQVTAQIDGQAFSSFSPTKTTYDMGETTTSHSVRLLNIPSGWTDTTASSTSTTSDKMTITHTLSNGSLSRTYTFQWTVKTSTPADPWASLKFAMNGTNYAKFDPAVRSYNVDSPITRSSWSGLPSGTTTSNKTTTSKNGDKTVHTLTWTLKYGGETRAYTFSWTTTDSAANNDSNSNSDSNFNANNGADNNTNGNNSSSGNNVPANSGDNPSGNEQPYSNGSDTPSENSQTVAGITAPQQPVQGATTTTTSTSDTAQERVNTPTNTTTATSNDGQRLSSTGDGSTAVPGLLAILAALAASLKLWVGRKKR